MYDLLNLDKLATIEREDGDLVALVFIQKEILSELYDEFSFSLVVFGLHGVLLSLRESVIEEKEVGGDA